VLTVLGFDDPFLAADAVPLALEHHPIGLEGFDQLLVDFMRRKGLALRDLSQLPSGSASCWSKWAAGPRRCPRTGRESGGRHHDLAGSPRGPHLHAG